MKNNYQESCIC